MIMTPRFARPGVRLRHRPSIFPFSYNRPARYSTATTICAPIYCPRTDADAAGRRRLPRPSSPFHMRSLSWRPFGSELPACGSTSADDHRMRSLAPSLSATLPSELAISNCKQEVPPVRCSRETVPLATSRPSGGYRHAALRGTRIFRSHSSAE